MAVTEILAVGAALLVLYRLVLDTVGVEGLGVWSLVLALAFVAQVTDLGVAGGVVKFVSKYLARERHDVVSRVIQTAAISKGVLAGAVLLLAYPLMDPVLGALLPPEEHRLSLTILPQVLFSFWLMSMASVFQAGLEGFQRIDLRSAIVIGTSFLNLVLALALLPRMGLPGLAYARIAQTAALLLLTWLWLRRCLPSLPAVPREWNRATLREILGYGVNFQVISIVTVLVEPMAKALLAKFGSVAMLGYFEMAGRMVYQFRSLIVAANQVVVPAIADLQEKNEALIAHLYRNSYRVVFYITVPSFPFLIALTPLISEIWIGHYESFFVYTATILCIAWAINTLSGPAYFAGLGTGRLRLNVVSHVMMGITNLVFGAVLGFLLGGVGVVAGFALALGTGSLLVPIVYHVQHDIKLSDLAPRESMLLSFLSVAGALTAVSLYATLRDDWTFAATATLVVLVFGTFVFLPAWRHPVRRQLVKILVDLRQPGSTDAPAS